MKKFWTTLVVLTLVAVVLAACGGGAAQSPVKTETATPKPATAAATAAVTAAVTATVTATPLPGGCAVAPILYEPDPVFPAVTDADWSKGSKTAAITLLEYSDFQCPYCSQLSPTLDNLVKAYPNDVRLVYRYFPLNIHDKAIISAQAAEAAGMQGKFWEMHTLLMSKQSDWSSKSVADFVAWVNEQAKTISGLDVAKFNSDLNSQAVVDKIKAALSSAEKIGLDSTPFLVINGRAFGGSPDEATLNEIVRIFKQVTTVLGPIRAKECPAKTIDTKKTYTATVTTSKGEFTMQLYADKAPIAVNSFIYLVNRGWYNNVPFHRVVANFVAQTGDPSGTGLGNPGYQFINEIDPSLKFDKAGVVGLANSGPNSNGSQFFITFGAVPTLDGNYTIFGQVTSGMDVVQKLTVRDPQFGQTNVPEPDTITKITISEK